MPNGDAAVSAGYLQKMKEFSESACAGSAVWQSTSTDRPARGWPKTYNSAVPDDRDQVR
jgi:hypothetical protein